jgi:hypothetical protein
MGQAKLRGTKEQRIAQALERQEIEAAASRERFRLSEIDRKEREHKRRMEQAERDGIPPVMVAGGGSPRRTRSHVLAAAMALAAGPLMVISSHDEIARRNRKSPR